jgi:hypothetical protein
VVHAVGENALGIRHDLCTIIKCRKEKAALPVTPTPVPLTTRIQAQ